MTQAMLFETACLTEIEIATAHFAPTTDRKLAEPTERRFVMNMLTGDARSVCRSQDGFEIGEPRAIAGMTARELASRGCVGVYEATAQDANSGSVLG